MKVNAIVVTFFYFHVSISFTAGLVLVETTILRQQLLPPYLSNEGRSICLLIV